MPEVDSRHVASRIYYDDPETLEFSAVVTAIREVARVDGKQIWQMALDHTAFYPESGGQPCDTGILTATARSGATLQAPVTDVQEDVTGEVWHTSTKPLQEGTLVQGVVDARRRRDHMQQHSGQHLLSAVLWRERQLKTVSFHLGVETCTIDVEGGLLDDETRFSSEAMVNAIVAQALPITIGYATAEEAKALLLAGRLRKLPQRAGTIRLIEIAGTDLNACGGTHVRSTAEIGPILLRGTERVRNAVRLHFVCGDRALRAAHADHLKLGLLADSLSTGVADLPCAVERLRADSRANAKERIALLQTLADAEAMCAVATLQPPTPFLLRQLDPALPGRTAEYAKLLASALVATSAVQRVLVALPQAQTCTLVLAAAQGNGNCGAELQAALKVVNGRGGGSREMAQGSCPISALGDVAVFLQQPR